ncbi:hypothetical protein ERO13_A02G042101v2 [Gossypium hirsutum]|uniref:Uncharacterized protein n=1 Tax=Gossypium darwinii TaxID=34276 RepID=A0A5D2HCA8_GOSDA|nr:hypothetical protein ERO13_A02G042101v2 [Gossypium hirsutum]TYH27209.1 hypothetical protein ES288_A02G051200v1 [Gossypium darwinii]
MREIIVLVMACFENHTQNIPRKSFKHPLPAHSKLGIPSNHDIPENPFFGIFRLSVEEEEERRIKYLKSFYLKKLKQKYHECQAKLWLSLL